MIRALHVELKGTYDRPRRVREPRARGFSASRERVERLIRDNGITARQQRRHQVMTDSKHGLPVAKNLLARSFAPTAPRPEAKTPVMSCRTNSSPTARSAR